MFSSGPREGPGHLIQRNPASSVVLLVWDAVWKFCPAPQLLLGLVVQSNRHWKSAGHWWEEYRQGQECRKFAHLSHLMMLRTGPKVNPPPCAPLRSTPRLYLTESLSVTHEQGGCSFRLTSALKHLGYLSVKITACFSCWFSSSPTYILFSSL